MSTQQPHSLHTASETPIEHLSGVGPKLAQRLHLLGIKSVQDLIYYFPRAQEDLTEITDIIDIEPGQKYTIQGTVERLSGRRARRGKMYITQAKIADATDSIQAIWFNQPYIQDNLAIGEEVIVSGMVKQSGYGKAFQSPVYEKMLLNKETLHTGRIVSHYSLTAGITQKQIRFFIKKALDAYLPLPDYLPAKIQQQYSLIPLSDALQQIHFPQSIEEFKKAQRRIEFDELYILQLTTQRIRQELRSQHAPQLTFHEQDIRTFVKTLPFQLTNAQRKSAWEILQDLERMHPMNRLLIGDVGSGKTVVAAIALLNTVLNGYQGILMVPTEILAKQHVQYLKQLFAQYNFSIELWTSSTKKSTSSSKSKTVSAQQLQPFESNIIVGTHALIQDYVHFRNLGLAIVDEQHRFGVRQRKTLKEDSNIQQLMPHLLSMTATPIPRTLALGLYGDLDISLIDEKPKNRKKIITRVVPMHKRPEAYTFIRKHIQQGEQVFILCPRIETSETEEIKSVTEEFERLQKEVFPDLTVGMLHGKMKAPEKDAVMQSMRARKLDILVATSVIEVGVDIPHATIMVIENAEHFGLAQLHQFRGRVGRSDTQSYCFLFTHSRSESTTDRLQALTKSDNGFELAQFDLEQRGAGEIFGTIQSGFSKHSMINFQNLDLLHTAQEAALLTFKQDWLKKYPKLQERLHNFIQGIHLE